MTFQMDQFTANCIVSAFIVGLVAFIRLRPRLYPQELSDSDLKGDRDYIIKLVGWEHDRVLAIAKGIAGTAVTFFVALIPLVVDNKLGTDISGSAVLGVILGFAGSLILACNITVAATTFTRDPRTAKEITGVHNGQ